MAPAGRSGSPRVRCGSCRRRWPATRCCSRWCRPERLVGLSSLSRDPKYSNVVAEASGHPAPSIESAEDILRLKPDLIFVASYSRAETVQVLESTGAPVYRLANLDDLDGIMDDDPRRRRGGGRGGGGRARRRRDGAAARGGGVAPCRPAASARAVVLGRLHRGARHQLRRHRPARRRHQRGGRPRHRQVPAHQRGAGAGLEPRRAGRRLPARRRGGGAATADARAPASGRPRRRAAIRSC